MAANYPVTSFHFQVDWGGARVGFSEVSGLDIEVEVIEYREGSDPEQIVRKIPGLKKFPNIVCKRGLLRGDNDLFEWMNTHKQGAVERRTVTISLLDEEHQPVIVWKAENAWPVKITGPDLKAAGNEIAIETLEICHEGLTIENG